MNAVNGWLQIKKKSRINTRMDHRSPLPLLTFLFLFTLQGCASWLPSGKTDVKSPWNTFAETKTAFDKIIPNQTTKEDLKTLGYDPFASPNITILTYLEIIQLFTANPAFKKEDLDKELTDCLDVKKHCTAYQVVLRRIREKRYGNFFLDILRFNRKTEKSGWEFRAFIVLKNGMVVYKLWSGKPMVDEHSQKKNPLGPLQEPVDLIPSATSVTVF